MLNATYNLYLVGLSYLVAVFGSYTAFQLAIRIPNSKGFPLLGWLGGSSLAMGGGAIWSMHFIGMQAYQIPIQVGYDPLLTIGSLIIASVAVAVGFLIVGMGQSDLIKLTLAGLIVGLGIYGMYYTGMAAMKMKANTHYDPLIVTISLVITIVAVTFALWLAFNLRGNWQRYGSAMVMGIAICGMHYIGMSAIKLIPNKNIILSEIGLVPEVIGIIIFIIAVLLLIPLLILALHNSFNKPSKQDIIFD